MKKYKVFLSKTKALVCDIAEKYEAEFASDNPEAIEEIKWGESNDSLVPQFFRRQGYLFMCCVTYSENASVKPYELIFEEEIENGDD